MELFRIRLNCVDHYQSIPTEFDPDFHRSHGQSQQKNAPQVPVIRVFGATETGQKVCAHFHGMLPYLYIEYDGSLASDEGQAAGDPVTRGATDFVTVDAYNHRLRLSIDHALAVSYRRNPYDGKSVYVAYITLVKGIPFYGYSVGYRLFLKVYLFNPLHMTRLADLLHQGAIMKRSFQPYEGHLQYLAQWMCDYNLFGCAYINCEKYKFRGPVPEWQDMESMRHRWHSRSIGSEDISDPNIVPRQSYCSIEVDVRVEDIINRRDVQQRDLHHDFVERLRPLAPEDKLVQSMAGLWKDETRRRKKKMGITDPSSSPFLQKS